MDIHLGEGLVNFELEPYHESLQRRPVSSSNRADRHSWATRLAKRWFLYIVLMRCAVLSCHSKPEDNSAAGSRNEDHRARKVTFTVAWSINSRPEHSGRFTSQLQLSEEAQRSAVFGWYVGRKCA